MGDGNSFPLVVCVFSGNFGVRSIVLCKCSGDVLIGHYYYQRSRQETTL